MVVDMVELGIAQLILAGLVDRAVVEVLAGRNPVVVELMVKVIQAVQGVHLQSMEVAAVEVPDQLDKILAQFLTQQAPVDLGHPVQSPELVSHIQVEVEVVLMGKPAGQVVLPLLVEVPVLIISRHRLPQLIQVEAEVQEEAIVVTVDPVDQA